MNDIFGRYADDLDNWDVTSETEQVPHPKNFRYNLMPYQLASIYVMNQMETYKTISENNKTYSSCAGVLTNDMGSGKTATILGLITHNPMPSYGPYYPVAADPVRSASAQYYPVARNGAAVRNRDVHSGTPRCMVLRKFKVVLRPALIFVGSNVVQQWAGEIMKFNPTLRFLIVEDRKTLTTFYALIHTPQINNYDLILIKNKALVNKWEFTHDEVVENVPSATSIYNMIGMMCRNMCFTRLVIDDFDTIGMPLISCNLNALFTWFMSSTKKAILKREYQNFGHATVESFVHHNNIACSDIINNVVLYRYFNVHVAASYYSTMNVGQPQFYYYKFANTNGKILDLISNMIASNISEIMEALNGDAIDHAAKLAGIEASDANQILKMLLHKNYKNMADARIVLDHFSRYFDHLDMDLPPAGISETYTRRDIRAGRVVERLYPGLRYMLIEEKARCQTVYDECHACLEKFKSSVKTNECQVCCLELNDADENYAILPCCTQIIHADCAVRGCSFRKETSAGGVIIVGTCPFNKTHRVLLNKLCYIKGEFDLSSISDLDTRYVEPVVYKDERRSKYDAILDIVRGRRPPEQTKINMYIPALVVGSERLGEPGYITKAPNMRATFSRLGYPGRSIDLLMDLLFAEWTAKVLVFANFDESLNNIEQVLKTNNITYDRLGGTSTQVADQISHFKLAPSAVLLIKSTVHCASLNLQEATDLIFAHRITDPHIQSQVAGRIQRSGRFTDARIHFMLYDNEMVSLGV